MDRRFHPVVALHIPADVGVQRRVPGGWPRHCSPKVLLRPTRALLLSLRFSFPGSLALPSVRCFSVLHFATATVPYRPCARGVFLVRSFLRHRTANLTLGRFSSSCAYLTCAHSKRFRADAARVPDSPRTRKAHHTQPKHCASPCADTWIHASIGSDVATRVERIPPLVPQVATTALTHCALREATGSYLQVSAQRVARGKLRRSLRGDPL